ncbi:MAG: GGDEF and EAL domain-containing protein [Actinomycetota bacterium]
MTSSWNRRVAAASRVRDNLDPEGIEERLTSLGLPKGLHPDDAVAVMTLLRVAEGRTNGFSTTLQARVTDDDGGDRVVKIIIMGNESGAATLIADADDEFALDTLTGLPGREYLLRALSAALQDTVTGERSVAVYSIDIDRFKTINDTRGFAAGDEALRTLATKLEDTLRADDVLGRFGGDEFTIVCPDVLGVAEATTLAERFRAACIDAPVDSPLAGLTVSVGIAVGSGDRAAEDLIREAETALYQAKGLGRDRCELFDEELRSRAERRNTVDQRLRSALDDDAIQVHYQPIVTLPAQSIVGCEALLRIVGEDGQHLNPRELIGAAEDSGLIRRIEETVLLRAASAVRMMPDPDEPMFLSLNVSDRRLTDSRFPLALARSLHNADLPAEQVHLELHPGVLGQKGPGTRLITQLRALGVCVVIDEFLGANDPELIDGDTVDIVKLDKRLVHGIHGERGLTRARLVIESLIDRGVDVCAVGVETQADVDLVHELGCRYAQGYVFSPPVEAHRFSELIVAR